MVRSRTPSQGGAGGGGGGGGGQGFEMERKYSVPSNPDSRAFSGTASEDLHAWSIYRQNLNSDFTDSALGSTDKSPLPYGNFQLRDTTVQSILSHPRYGPKSALGSNMYTYLKFGLPRVFPPNHNGSNRSGTPLQSHHHPAHHQQQQQQHQQQQQQQQASSAGPPHHHMRTGGGPASRQHMRGAKGSSRIGRDGSSGYDSSDNETTNQYKYNRKYRSDPDFRMQNVHPSYHAQTNAGIPLAAMQQGGIRQNGGQNHNQQQQWNRNKSISEANLLNAEYGYQHLPPHMRGDARRNSVAEFSHPHGHDMIIDHGHMINRPMSKAESHMSVAASRRGPSVIRGDYLSHDEEVGTPFMYPHLQILGLGILPSSNLSLHPKQHLLINDITFEVRGGEVMAVMATNEAEGTAHLGCGCCRCKQVVGEILLNGQQVRAKNLKNRVAYVQRDAHLCKDMTVLQTLNFHYDLKRPTAKLEHLKIDAIDRLNVLIEDLGLEQVRNTKVSAMTISECRRLNVACHLLLDTDIVVLDQPTRGMDIFDTFFLVEYLRQWANGGTGRIVILTLHPPTYEIFTMLSRILLISAGRAMYSGSRRDMLPYFAKVNFHCPAFKNPSDYYLDLVTLDDLSAEAMLESSQRIEQLAEAFRQKQLPLSDPGPPSTLPMTVKNSNCIAQAFVLFTKSIVYTQPATFVRWLSLILISVAMSLALGAIWWDVPATDAQLALHDRQGYHHAVAALCVWPVLLALTLAEERANWHAVDRDVRDGLYGRWTYVVTKSLTTYDLLRWLSLILISVAMSLALGAIWWDVPATDAQLALHDRQGYHHAVAALCMWPVLLALTLVEERANWHAVDRDVRDGLYGRWTYVVTKSLTTCDLLRWLSLILISVAMSLALGAIWWDVPATDAQLALHDRQGYHHAVAALCVWPVLLALTLAEERANWHAVDRDVRDGLYGRWTYVVTKTVTNLLPSLFVWLVYLVPSYSMSGLYMQSTTSYSGFYIYLGLMLLYLACIQIFVMSCIYLFPCPTFATVLSATFVAAFALSTGYAVHHKDIAVYAKWLQYVSPPVWLVPALLQREFTHEAIASSAATTLCRNKQVQHQDIIVQLPCPPPNGTQILSSFGYLPSQREFYNYGNPIAALVVFYVLFFFVACVSFTFNCCRRGRNQRRNTDSNKP